MSEEEELNITVAVRCRGRNEKEVKAKSSVVVAVPDITGTNEVSVNTTGDTGITAQINSKTYTVDRVFGPSADQSLIFKVIAEPLFQDFIKGYNCTVLVYGMTSTGKTYTMTGDERLYDGELSEGAGIIPRVLFKLFDALDAHNDDYMIKCSFIELYNEELKDLLDETPDSSMPKKLRIFDSVTNLNSSRSSSRNSSPKPPEGNNTTAKRRVRANAIYKPSRSPIAKSTLSSELNSAIHIQNLQEFHIMDAKEGIRLLQRGLRHRQVASTKMNDVSSRSHTIFTIMLYRKCNGESFRVSKMNLVDLAGSENISRSGAQNQRAKEAGSINQSLLTLGRVINSLADKSAHIPFRESKLTRLLQDSLGGNTKTALIATISPAKINSEETSSTLEYATKAKNIKNKPQVGSFIMKDVLVKNVTAELVKIRSDLLATKSKDGIYMSQENYKELTNELENYKTEVQECKRAIERLSTQNGLISKEKRITNEVNESQKLKIKKLSNNIEFLYDKIDRQHRNEQELSNVVQELMRALRTMQNSLKVYEDQGLRFQTEMERVLYENIGSFKHSLLNEIEKLKGTGEESFDIDANVDSLSKELNRIYDFINTSTIEICQKFINKVSEQTPNYLQDIRTQVESITKVVGSYSSDLMMHLSSISEEYNHLKDYLNEHFFKNNFQDALDVHVDRTYHQLKVSANSIFLKLREMMNEELETNKEIMMQSLKNAASEVVAKEMGLLDPVKQAWESSLENINECDKLNSGFEKDIGNVVGEVFQRINKGRLSSEIAISEANSDLSRFQGAFQALQSNDVIPDSMGGIKRKHDMLKLKVQDSASYIEAATQKFSEIDKSIQGLLNLQTVSQPQNESRIEGLLEQLDGRPLKPLGPSGKTPMRITQGCITNSDQLSLPRKRAYSISPIRELDGNRKASSPLKRKVAVDNENVPFTSQKIE